MASCRLQKCFFYLVEALSAEEAHIMSPSIEKNEDGFICSARIAVAYLFKGVLPSRPTMAEFLAFL